MTTTPVDTWQALLAAHARIAERLDRDLDAEVGMGLAEFEVLDHLVRAEDLTIRMNELAALVRLSPSGLTRRFDTLVRRGLVVREPCSDDRRGINARLTAEGLARHSEAAVVHRRGVEQYVTANLDAHELQSLATALTRLDTANAAPASERVNLASTNTDPSRAGARVRSVRVGRRS